MHQLVNIRSGGLDLAIAEGIPQNYSRFSSLNFSPA